MLSRKLKWMRTLMRSALLIYFTFTTTSNCISPCLRQLRSCRFQEANSIIPNQSCNAIYIISSRTLYKMALLCYILIFLFAGAGKWAQMTNVPVEAVKNSSAVVAERAFTIDAVFLFCGTHNKEEAFASSFLCAYCSLGRL